MTGERPGHESRVPAFGRLVQQDLGGCLARAGERRLGHKGIVARIQHQRRRGNMGQPGLAGAMSPVVERVAKAMHGRRIGIVEVPQILRARHPEAVDRAGKPRCLFNDLGL